MIQLKKKPEAKDSLTIKMWWMNPKENKWEEVKDRWILLSDLDGSCRLLFEVNSSSIGTFCIATHDKDVKSLLAKRKYPVVPAAKILKFFNKECDQDDLRVLMPKVVLAIDELGGRIVN